MKSSTTCSLPIFSSPQAFKMARVMCEHDGPMYIRTSREPVENVTTMDDEVLPGKAQKLIDGGDLLIIATGMMTVLAVQADVTDAQPPDVTQAIWADLQDVIATLPPGYRIDIGGSVEQSGKADASIQKVQPIMLGLILIVIMLQMRSFSGTLMVIATAPLGIIGATLALLIADPPFGFVALLGLIGLAGLLMRNLSLIHT